MDPARFAQLRDAFVSALITGTNGKTTTTSMLASIVVAAGQHVGRATTLGAWVDDEPIGEGTELALFEAMLARAAERGARILTIETTSKALAAGFSHRWPGDVAVFTNLTHDHLDEHGDGARYLASKAQAFVTLRPPAEDRPAPTAVLNLGDPASALIAELIPPHVRVLGFAIGAPCEACESLPLALAASRVEVDADGTRVALARSTSDPLADALGGALALLVIGAVHAENALAAALAAHALGLPADAIARGLAAFAGVPGRFEVVNRDHRDRAGAPLVAVDYAHTPDALARVLETARALATARSGRVWCVFGCGGDRDPTKRGEMGRVAAAGADEIVLTTDNPRSEDPRAIEAAVLAGIEPACARVRREPDRRAAIESAIRAAEAGDIVVVAGKGHERTQTIGPAVIPFSDVEIARASLDARHTRHLKGESS
jgi:UDP-N-acetylmuramoyl-L-alanyl-D-glutamate--2,6-diaminopimelate ligase